MSSATKRPVEDGAGGESPPVKKIQFEPLQIGPVSSLEEMDVKILQFQNKKLSQRLELRLKTEVELKQRIEQLEKRQIQDDTVLNLVNRYWNVFNEDVRIILQRFDAEAVEETEGNDEESANSFLTLLSTWDKTELEEKLASRVQVSSSAVSKIMRAFERLLASRNKLTMALKGEGLGEGEEIPSLDDSVKEINSQLQEENKRLHSLNSTLHEKSHTLSLKNKELQEQLTARETEAAELTNRLDDIQYEFDRISKSNHNLEHNLADALENLKQFQAIAPPATGAGTAEDKPVSKLSSYNQRKVDELVRDLEEQKELAGNRLAELDKLHQEHKAMLQQLEHVRMDIKQLPESIIVETTEYKCLQSQFSVLYNESMALKTQLDEVRIQMNTVKNAHLRQIEQMEAEELLRQKQLRTEVITLEDMLAQVRKEYEMLRIEFEQQLAANEQTGPINREMRHLITSLQNHNHQLKGEIGRYKRKYREIAIDQAKTRKELDDVQTKLLALEQQLLAKEEENQAAVVKDETKPEVKPEPVEEEGSDEKIKLDDEKKPESDPSSGDEKKEVKAEKGSAESEIVRELKSQLKKALADQREMKLLLDLHKGASKDMRDKAQILAAEKKARLEVEDLKNQIKRMQETKREDRKKMAEEDALKKIKQLDDMVHQLQKQVAAQKLEEEALLNEMEVTGQAYEDMQEQNSRLIQQLREKDDANFKLMSERIKSQQVQKLQREEKELLAEQVSTLGLQVEAQNQVIRRLEEKERILQNSLALAEREVMLRQQALELHKRKAIESAQSANDLKLHLEKYHAQVKEAQQAVGEKTSALEGEVFKTKRIQEDLAQLRKRMERLKKIEAAGTADEVLREELREYKESLTCPSCKVKRKDAVLTKCFHVFCFDCLRTRYETRQRKCPKCNAAFGANDYHRLYLA